jgi:spore maturation protein CgeB
MKIAVLDTYYPKFLDRFYTRESLALTSYDDHLQRLIEQCFGTSDFYSFNMKSIGIETIDIVMNDQTLQEKWALEHFGPSQKLPPQLDRAYRGVMRRIGLPRLTRTEQIILAQIEEANPDVVYCQDPWFLPPRTVMLLKKSKRLLVSQIASPLPNDENIKAYDLMLSSFPHFVQKFRSMGINSEYFKIGFESRLLEKVPKAKRDIDVSFVGGLAGYHGRGVSQFEEVAKKYRLDVWGYGVDKIPHDSPLLKHYRGEAWALDMYGVFARSKITLNRHIDLAENYANNMRLYEATGMGALLITDERSNLGELFTPGKEIVTYKDSSDLTEKVRYYLDHDYERDLIARAGQARTLSEHTYKIRMKELAQILAKNL